MPGAAKDDEWAAPPLADLIVRPPHGASGPADASRVAAELLSVRSPAGRFLVPADSRRSAARSLRCFNRLRPRRTRAARAALGVTLALGGRRLVSDPHPILAAPGSAVLLDHLATVLGEPRVVFAATEQGGSGFVTPVLQLFSPAGRCLGFAKIGWDEVTSGMVRTEADALARAAAAGWETVAVPDVVWYGDWEGLTVLVTAPLPSRVRRLRAPELPPVAPLREVVALDGPVARSEIAASPYWRAALATAARATDAGRTELARELERCVAHHGDANLAFGRWHGDWVEWNLATTGGRLYAWDWAYSAPAVPVGFDVVQFFHLRHRNLRGAAPEAALARAADDAQPGLLELGLGPDERRAVVALHRVETRLRLERARQARAGHRMGDGSHAGRAHTG